MLSPFTKRRNIMKYYSTQRPITPGSFPKPVGNQIMEILNYDCKTYCEEIGRDVWGYIDYAQPLHPEYAIDYELIPPPSKVKTVVFIGIDRCHREVFEDEGGKLWKYTKPGPMPRERHDRLFTSTNNALDGEPCWPMMPDIDYTIKDTDHDVEKIGGSL